MASSGKATLEQFSGGDFAEYRERLEFYFLANDIGVVSASANSSEKERVRKKMIAHLISSLSKDVYSTLRNLCLPESISDKTFEQICDLLNGYYRVERSTMTSSFQFRDCNQRPAEKLVDYANRLKRAAVACDFGSHLDRSLKDQFMAGVYSQEIKRTILTSPDSKTKKFQDVLDIALREERAIMFAEQLTPGTTTSTRSTSTPSESVNKMRATTTSKSKSASASRKPNHSQDQKGSKSTKGKVCYRCTSDLHMADKCPHRSTTCRYCKKRGHLERACITKQKRGEIHHVDDEPDDRGEIVSDCDVDDMPIYKIRSGSGKHPPYTVMAEINDVCSPICMKIDTGSAVSIITKSDYEKLGAPVSSLVTQSVQLIGFSGSIIPCLGEGKFPVSINGQKHTVLLRIVDTNGPSLLGRDLLSLFKLEWREIFSVKSEIDNALIRAKLQEEMLQKFESLFDTSTVGKLNSTRVTLRVNDSKPVYMKARSVPFAIREKYEQGLSKLEEEGVIRKVEFSKWASPTVPVQKPDGNVRICADYSRTINANSDLEKYPLPTIDEIRAKLNGGQKFTKLDLSQAYHQLELDPKSRGYTTINTHRGLFEYVRLPFGIHSAVSIFQRTMETLLAGIDGCIVYVDDILVTGRNDAEHKRNLEMVLQRLQDAGMRLKATKTEFMLPQVSYLGHTLSASGMAPSPGRIDAMVNANAPTSVSELQSFIGSANYVRKFIPNFARIMAPLYALLKKDTVWRWSDSEQTAFLTIKNALCSTEVLAHYSAGLEHVLQCDASGTGLGAVLLQKNENGDYQPISYASRLLNKAERNYSNIERESLALVFGATKFRQYLLGKKFVLETDHKPLVKLFGMQEGVPFLVSSRLKKWKLLLSAYDYTIQHIAGKANVLADFMSRKPISGNPSTPELGETRVLFIEDELIDAQVVLNATGDDPVLERVRHYTLNGWPEHVKKVELQPYFVKRWELSIVNDVLLWNERVVIPMALRAMLLSELHSEHTGAVRMKRMARRYFWWPKMDDEIEDTTKMCATCQEQARKPSKSYATWSWPSGPWRRLHIDFAGPFMGKMFLVIVDAYTKYLEIVPMTHATSTGTIKALRRLFATFGLPTHIVSDNGTQFTSAEFTSFLQKNGIAHTRSAPGHPETNGLAERYVGHFKAKMKAMGTEGDDLDTRLQRFLMTFRSTPTANGKSPAEMLFNRQPRLRYDALKTTRNAEAQSFNQNQHLLPEYKPGDAVFALRFQNHGTTWVPGVVLSICSAMNYSVQVNDVVWKRHRNQLRPRSIPLSQLAEQTRSAPQQQQLQPQQQQLQPQQQQQQQLSPQQQQPQPQQQQVPQQLPPQKAQQPTTSQQKEQPRQQSQDEQGQQSLASTAPADAVPVDRQVTRSGRSVVRPARYNG